ncbi:MAG: DUF6771 family protein [Pseudomonadota bacterium]
MDTIGLEPVARALLTSPPWQRLGIAVRDPRLREQAALALAASIVERLHQPAIVDDPNQLSLAL